jgi:hypothetical protein
MMWPVFVVLTAWDSSSRQLERNGDMFPPLLLQKLCRCPLLSGENDFVVVVNFLKASKVP